MKKSFDIGTAFSFLLIFSLVAPAFVRAADKTTVREYTKVYKTYPFSEPNPIPAPPPVSDVYPYFKYDGYAVTPDEKAWKIVELFNDYISLEIFPEIGGKIWSATDKKTGKAFIYSNPVVKFRNISLRGPWTSGGLEMNVGIIGHASSCSWPVDYAVRENPDGSASCLIGCLDLVTRSDWTLEIRLPADSSAFSTRAFWNNGSELSQPYYTWMCLGLPARDDLENVNPGTAYIGHAGDAHAWPIDDEGHRLNWYRENNFGTYKSYHVLGSLAEYFGAYYHDDDFGVASVAPSESKRGRKIWLWGLSRLGMIWRDILTDPPMEQYIEIQTGRLFNQTAGNSRATPFKQRELAPFTTENWIEYWMPVHGIGGMNAASAFGAMNVKAEGNRVIVGISPAVPMTDSLEIFDGDKKLASVEVTLSTSEPFVKTFSFDSAPEKLAVRLGRNKLVYSSEGEAALSRPLANEYADSKEDGISSDWLSAKESSRERNYKAAAVGFNKCLERDPTFIPALTGLAEIMTRRGEYERAIDYARRALQIDTYDGAANYLFGLASLRIGELADAQDAFSVATMDMAYRVGAFIGLGKVYMKNGRIDDALGAFNEGLCYNMKSPDLKLCKLRALAELDSAAHERLAREILDENPLAHFARVELYLTGKMSAEEVYGALRCELPHETFLELAVRYAEFTDKAPDVLKLGLGMPGINKTEMLYHLAYYARDKEILAEAEKRPVDFCFPFRPESVPVFQWAKENGSTWRNAYYLAVLLQAIRPSQDRNETTAPGEMLRSLGDEPNEAVFYAFRGQLSPDSRLADYEKAVSLDGSSPKIAQLYAEELKKSGDQAKFLETAEKYYHQFNQETVFLLLYAHALKKNGKLREAAQLLENGTVLPYEGSSDGRTLLNEILLDRAIVDYQNGDYDGALEKIAKAREWPENLGAGKPYDADCDERLEDYFAYCCLRKIGRTEEASAKIKRILDKYAQKDAAGTDSSFGRFAATLAMRADGRKEDADKLLNEKFNGAAALDQELLALGRGEDGPTDELKKSPQGRVLLTVLK